MICDLKQSSITEVPIRSSRYLMKILFLFLEFCSNTSDCLCSYQWIARKGKPAPREMAPIVVSNHISFIEPIFYFYEFFPTMVASQSHDTIPFVGTIIRAMQVNDFDYHVLKIAASSSAFVELSTVLLVYCASQVIYVNRFDPSSRKNAVNEIKVKGFYTLDQLDSMLLVILLFI